MPTRASPSLTGATEAEVRATRKQKGIEAVFNSVDTCGAEFEAFTPYLYSTYEGEDESKRTPRKKIMILGGGPNRIGQGIEFDYCCVHAAFALKEEDYETIMVNCNPETVSTDYDTSDKLYFEPLTMEEVMNIVDREKPDGVIVQFGGQTPLKLALALEQRRRTDHRHVARQHRSGRRPRALLGADQSTRRSSSRTTASRAPTTKRSRSPKALGYPVLVRPSYVLGGRAMQIVYDGEALQNYMTHAVSASPEHPVLIDKFLDDAIEVDVDALGDGEDYVIGGIMEHIERAGVHSGDSACSLPPKTISREVQDEIRRHTVALAKALNVRGLMNVQFAVQGSNVFVFEVNPRASRTVPFVSKAIGVPLAKMAAKIMVGKKLNELGLTREIVPTHISVKEAVFPFNKFPGVDTLLGPEMKSTGEVMGIDNSFRHRFRQSSVGRRRASAQTAKCLSACATKTKSRSVIPAAKT